MAIPTAMPADPFTRRLGSRLGRSIGSFKDPSKLSAQETVSFSRSSSISEASGESRASV